MWRYTAALEALCYKLAWKAPQAANVDHHLHMENSESDFVLHPQLFGDFDLSVFIDDLSPLFDAVRLSAALSTDWAKKKPLSAKNI